MSDEVVVEGRVNTSQDGIVVNRGGMPVHRRRSWELPQSLGTYRELNRRTHVMVTSVVRLIPVMKMRLSRTISV